MESLLPFFHKKRFSIHSKKPTQKSNQPLYLLSWRRCQKGPVGNFENQGWCNRSAFADWDEGLSYLYLYFPMDLMGTGIGSSLLQTIFLASQSWISPKVSVERIWVNFVKCLPFRGSLLPKYILVMTSHDVKRMYHHHGAGNGALSIPPYKCLFVADPQCVLTHTSHITKIYRSTTDSAMM